MSGQQLVERIVAFLRRYVFLTEGQALTAALWVLNTYTYERFAAVPYLEIWAMHKRSGKTTLAECLNALARGGRVLATVRTLQMVRLIEAKDGHYVPFIEEAERFWKGSLGDERAILATGYRKGASHEISSMKGETQQFRTFCPKAFILIGNVHPILRDRCISLKLERGTPTGNWTMERFAGEAEARTLVEEWRKQETALIAAGPMPIVDPDWLPSSRDREIWSPLFSLAVALKLHKAQMDALKRASVDLSALKSLPPVKYSPSQDEPIADDTNAADAVLAHARSVFGSDKFLPTDELLTRLHGIDTAPWRVWQGTGLDAISLGALLSRFGVSSTTGQVGKQNKKTGEQRRAVKGYKLSDLDAGAKRAGEK